jgi:hypothetical protein
MGCAMKKIILLSVLLLSACGWDMDVGTWQIAKDACYSRGSEILQASKATKRGTVIFRCMDGYEGAAHREK